MLVDWYGFGFWHVSWSFLIFFFENSRNLHGSKRPRDKSTKLTSQFHRFRRKSRKNEILENPPGQKRVIQIERSNSRISCTWNGARRSSWKVFWVTKRDYAFETTLWTKRQKIELEYSRSWRATIECMEEGWSIKKLYKKNWIINKMCQDIKLIFSFSC